ncbi:MAG: hypothetical protein OYI31_07010 [Chloroflexota bacterium]|nr:hypothetical protein [Chloroflexota bacterium]MDE2941198.1 hypothetical protein [Chloroflexota bacterium]MDE3268176.1 hypothetical protein [Chloroflexota bacterium]
MINRDMLYTSEQRSSKGKWIVLLVVASLVSLAIGLLAGSALQNPPEVDTSDLDRQIEELKSQVGQLQSQLDAEKGEKDTLLSSLDAANRAGADLRSQLADAEAMVTAAQSALSQSEMELESSKAAVTGLEEQNRQLTGQVGELHLRVDGLHLLSDGAETHRLLLVEMRKDPPDTREGAFEYWNTIKDRAVRANPGLSSPVDRVILKIDNFFDWAERSPNAEPTSDEYLSWLEERVTSGAAGYQESADAFFKEALLSTISQLEAIVGRLN